MVSDGDRRFAAFALTGDGEDQVVVIDDACPHNAGPLSEGVLRDGSIMCPWHFYTFDLVTGACRTTDRYRLRRHRVVEVDGEQYVEVPADRPRSLAETLRAHARGEA